MRRLARKEAVGVVDEEGLSKERVVFGMQLWFTRLRVRKMARL